MKCAKCGYERQSRDDAFVPPSECPACGVVYAKHDSAADTTKGAGAARPAHLKPSPVDPTSLRKARERVEKRLRERNGSRVKDERHAQTLKLAKRLTAEQIRKRRDEWKQSHSDKPPAQASAEAPETVKPARDPKAPEQAQTKTAPVKEIQAADTAQAEAVKTPSLETPPVQTVETPAQSVENLSPAAVESNAVATTDPDEDAPTLSPAAAEVIPAAEPQVHKPEEKSLDSAAPAPSEEPAASVSEQQIQAALAAAAALQQQKAGPGSGLTRLLPMVAWLILVAGVIGAVLSWTTIGDAQAGVRIPIPESVSTLPLGLLLGFAYLATGVLGFAFFWVSSLISMQLKDIRRMLISQDRGDDDRADGDTAQ